MAYTDSARGRWVLDNWPDMIGRFVKIMPADYKLALKRMKEEAAAESAGPVLQEVANG
jgi:glutamate synthase domain-containing protein 3